MTPDVTLSKLDERAVDPGRRCAAPPRFLVYRILALWKRSRRAREVWPRPSPIAPVPQAEVGASASMSNSSSSFSVLMPSFTSISSRVSPFVSGMMSQTKSSCSTIIPAKKAKI